MKGIKSIGHVAIRVKDIGRSLDFYVKKLGFAECFVSIGTTIVDRLPAGHGMPIH